MIYLSNNSRPSSSFYPSHLLFLFLSLFLVFLPSFTIAQQVAATLPATITSPLSGPVNAAITYTVNAQSTLVVCLIQTLQNQNERTVGESSTNVNAGNNQQATINNVKINNALPGTGGGIAYKWRVYSVNPDAYAFSPSIAFNAATASREYPVTVTAAAPTTPPTAAPTTTRPATTVAGQTTARPASTVPGQTTRTTARPAATTARPITTLQARTTIAPGGGDEGDQPDITDPPGGVIYKIISSTAVAGKMGMCAYTFQDGDTLTDIVAKLETTLGRLIQLNLDKFTQRAPVAGDILQYDCFLAEGSEVGDDEGPITRPPASSSSSRSSSSSSKSWIDNNVVIFIVVLVVGFCLAAFLSIVLYKHIQAQLSAGNNTKRIATEAKPAPPMSTPANRQWGTTNA